jgi:hypothetical protein
MPRSPKLHSFGNCVMAEEEEIPDTPDKAVRGWIVAIGFTLVLVGGEMMAEKDGTRFYLGAVLLMAAHPVYLSAAWWNVVRDRLSCRQISTLRLVANDLRWWFGLLAIVLIWLGISPLFDKGRWPFSNEESTNSEKIIVDIDPHTLIDMCKNSTGIECERQVVPFIRKWVKLRVEIKNIWSDGQGLTISSGDFLKYELFMHFDDNWSEQIKVLRSGQNISALCQIKDVFSTDIYDICEAPFPALTPRASGVEKDKLMTAKLHRAEILSDAPQSRALRGRRGKQAPLKSNALTEGVAWLFEALRASASFRWTQERDQRRAGSA